MIKVLANEIVLIVCQYLDDDDLLVLCRVSKCLNAISLNSFFVRHGISQDDITAGNFSLSSKSLRGVQLALFISFINKLSCLFHISTAESDILATERFVSRSRLSQIRDVEVTIDAFYSSDRPADGDISKVVLSLLLALIPDKPGTLIILHDGFFRVSQRRRMVRRTDPLCFRNWCGSITSRMPFFMPIGSLLGILARGAIDLGSYAVSVITDPLARSRQDDRIREDLRFIPRIPRSFHIRFPMLPIPPFMKWTMITCSTSMTSLYITSIPPLNEKWGALLPSIFLPSLSQLIIGNHVNLDLSHLLLFVYRHPYLNDLCFGHYSISYSSLTPLREDCICQLRFIAAPARLINHVLRSPQHFRNLCSVDIGPVPSTFRAYFNMEYPDREAKVETPFSFDDLNEALHAVANANATNVTLTIMIPAGKRSEKWLSPLSDDRETQRVERQLHNVTIVHLYLERTTELYSMYSLLPQWFELFPSVRQVWITGFPDPRAPLSRDLAASIYSSCPHVLTLDDVVLMEIL
jgi:hypothetical protein